MKEELKALERFIITTVENWFKQQNNVRRVSGTVVSYNSGDKIAQVKIAGDTNVVPIKNLTTYTLGAGNLVYIDIQNNNMTNAFISFKR